MEVPHHSSPAPSGTHTTRKNWTHYLWEFLMLFLAVFCGFLAEYMLEHKIEKEKEKQFIASLITDLQDDGKNLDTTMEFEHRGVAKLDTLLNLLNNPALAKQN
ncbi:MAG: hypothetical protein ABJA85_04635, partial [Bacteroidota bacterium]